MFGHSLQAEEATRLADGPLVGPSWCGFALAGSAVTFPLSPRSREPLPTDSLMGLPSLAGREREPLGGAGAPAPDPWLRCTFAPAHLWTRTQGAPADHQRPWEGAPGAAW